MSLERALPDIGEKYLRNPILLEVPAEDGSSDFSDDTADKWAWFAHGYDTGMEPFYSAGQIKAALEEAWLASRRAALEEAQQVCESVWNERQEVFVQSGEHYDQGWLDGADTCEERIRKLGEGA